MGRPSPLQDNTPLGGSVILSSRWAFVKYPPPDFFARRQRCPLPPSRPDGTQCIKGVLTTTTRLHFIRIGDILLLE